MTGKAKASRELVTLRVSLARIAQRLGIGDEIPGHVACTDDNEADYANLHGRAMENERGWNRLCACILDELDTIEDRARHVFPPRK